jgi:hypothetical protein
MVTNQQYLNERVESSKRNNTLGSSLRRFEASLNTDFVKSLLPVVNK